MNDPEGHEEVELDIAASFGAEADPSTQAFTIYVPNKDCDGKEIGNQRRWVLEALQLLSRIGAGPLQCRPSKGSG